MTAMSEPASPGGATSAQSSAIEFQWHLAELQKYSGGYNKQLRLSKLQPSSRAA